MAVPVGGEHSHDAPVPFDDRGLSYGDGVFETVLVRNGHPLLWPYHLRRLMHGCDRLGIPRPQRTELEAAFSCAVGLQVSKLIVTRGSGGRGYLPPANPEPRIRWRSTPFEPQRARWQEGIRVKVCDTRLARQPLLAGIKHLNRLENVLARQECDPSLYAEGVMLDTEGWVTDATAMNLAWFDGQQWLTPPLDQCGVSGTLRAALIERGLLFERRLHVDELDAVEALCLFNSVQGVWPVASLHQGAQAWRWSPQALPLARLSEPAQALLGYSHAPRTGAEGWVSN
ncbi:aminodeoxychorismate lyase [Carnimonas bestiolae]|uniref:aminodeoxychorismate lyase n=1 Tax=Carnimonas bestiolae TaxID=3402172 RepID=UPI003EDC1931